MSNEKLRDWNLESAREAGLLVARSLITLNSGAFVVLLTFIGNAQASTQFVIAITALKSALICFLVGISAVIVALVASYLSSAPHPETGLARFFEKKIVIVNASAVLLSSIAFIFGVVTIVFNVETG